MSDTPQERGPNYDWKHEAMHYRDAVEELRKLLRKVEVSSDEQIAALMAERDSLKQKVDTSCVLGVGDGSGQLFVYGDYDSIKAAQKLILERDEALIKLARYREALEKVSKLKTMTLLCDPADYDFNAEDAYDGGAVNAFCQAAELVDEALSEDGA